MYAYHFDYPNQQWNVFQVVNGQEQFYCSFKTLGEAKECVKIMMGFAVVG